VVFDILKKAPGSKDLRAAVPLSATLIPRSAVPPGLLKVCPLLVSLLVDVRPHAPRKTAPVERVA